MPEQGTRGFVQCSNVTGCGGRWTWHPLSKPPMNLHSWPEAAARAWTKEHLRVCAGPVQIVVTHRDGEPV